MNTSSSLINTSASSSTTTTSRFWWDNNLEEIKLPFFSALQLEVFKKFVENYSVSRELLREDAIALDYVFGVTIQHVFEMIEEELVTVRRTLGTKRTIVEVYGKSSRKSLWIPPGSSICQCMAYIHGKKAYCKHVLAAHLFLAITPQESYTSISDNQLDQIIKDFVKN